MSGRSSRSKPYSVTESKAVDRRLTGMSFDNRWKHQLVRNGSPSPANMRVGSSFSRLNGNTPTVNGNAPNRFSRHRQRRISPASSNFGSATFGTLVPESDVVVSLVRSSRPRTFVTDSSPEYALTVSG